MLVVPKCRHTIDATLAMFILIMKTVLGGAHPLTERDLQPLYAQKGICWLAGHCIVLKLVACSKPVVAGLGTNKYRVSIVE